MKTRQKANFFIHVQSRGEDHEIWFFEGERPIKRAARVNRLLALDAMRHGQDLVGEIIDILQCGIEGGGRLLADDTPDKVKPHSLQPSRSWMKKAKAAGKLGGNKSSSDEKRRGA